MNKRSMKGFDRKMFAVACNVAGYTLIELVLTIVLTGIIAGIGGMLILQGANAFMADSTRSDVTNQGRLASERMSREIRAIPRAGNMTAPTGNPTSTLQFVDQAGATVIYSLSGTTLNRTVNGVAFPLAVGVAALDFRHYDKAGALTTTPVNIWQIQIDLTAISSVESQAFRIRVHPRSLT